MNKEITFTEARPLIQFIEQNKDKIIGKPIRCFYAVECAGGFGGLSDAPIAFEFDDFVLILYYFIYSNLSVHWVSPDHFHHFPTTSDNELYKQEVNVLHECKANFPYIDCKIKNITVERFSDEFEVNCVTGETRPANGDYFKTITVHLEGNKEFYICGCGAEADGYIEIWDQTKQDC